MLLPEIQRELLRAARARLAHEHRRLLALRAGMTALIVVVLMMALPSTALSVSHPSTPPQQSLGNG
jgi:hypothetical protein